MPGIPGAKGHRGFAGSDGGKGIFTRMRKALLATIFQ